MTENCLFPMGIERTVWISACGRYRHALGRHWDRGLGYVLFVGLNPSTADGIQDDQTIRRCIGFSRAWGYGGIEMCNLFDWRTRDPKSLPRQSFAVSEFNYPTLKVRCAVARLIIACWGSVPWAQRRIDEVHRTVFDAEKRWDCLRLTKHGFPEHPCYLPKSLTPRVFW